VAINRIMGVKLFFVNSILPQTSEEFLLRNKKNAAFMRVLAFRKRLGITQNERKCKSNYPIKNNKIIRAFRNI